MHYRVVCTDLPIRSIKSIVIRFYSYRIFFSSSIFLRKKHFSNSIIIACEKYTMINKSADHFAKNDM